MRPLSLRRIARDGVLVMAGQIVSAIAVLATVRVLTEALEPSAYGLMVLIIGVASMANAVVVWPIGQVVMVSHANFAREERAEQFRDATAFVTSRLTWGGLALLTIVGGPVVGLLASDWSAGWFIGPLFLLEARRYVSMTLMMAAGRQRSAAVVYAADAWLRLLGAWVAVVFLGASVSAALGGTVAGALALSMTLAGGRWAQELLARRDPSMRPDPDAIRLLKERAIPLVPSAILSNISELGGRYVVASVGGLAMAGVYAAGVSLMRRPFGMLNSILDWSLKPAVAAAVSGGDQARSRRAFRAWVMVGAGASTVAAAIVVIFATPIVQLLLAAEYSAATHLIPWLALGMVLLNCSSIFSGVALVLGDGKVTTMATATGAVMTLLATYPLVLWWGTEGAAAAVACAYAMQLAVAIWLSVRRVRSAESGPR